MCSVTFAVLPHTHYFRTKEVAIPPLPGLFAIANIWRSSGQVAHSAINNALKFYPITR